MLLLQISNVTTRWDYILLPVGYFILVLTSGKLVNFILKRIGHSSLKKAAGDDDAVAGEKAGIDNEQSKAEKRLAAGAIIGKCENILILSFILLEAYTALALVVTAKTLVRKEEIEKNEMFFLAGTLINVCYSVIIGFVMKLLLAVV
jgi:hypothetical protein